MRPYSQVQVFPFRDDCGLEYLMLKRSEKKGGFWQPITGGVKLSEGESVVSAMYREIREEIGVEKSEIVRVVPDVYFFNWIQDRNPEDVLNVSEYVFGVEVAGSELISIGIEHIDKRWCGFGESLDLLKYDSNKEGLKRLNLVLDSGNVI